MKRKRTVQGVLFVLPFLAGFTLFFSSIFVECCLFADGWRWWT